MHERGVEGANSEGFSALALACFLLSDIHASRLGMQGPRTTFPGQGYMASRWGREVGRAKDVGANVGCSEQNSEGGVSFNRVSTLTWDEPWAFAWAFARAPHKRQVPCSSKTGTRDRLQGRCEATAATEGPAPFWVEVQPERQHQPHRVFRNIHHPKRGLSPPLLLRLFCASSASFVFGRASSPLTWLSNLAACRSESPSFRVVHLYLGDYFVEITSGPEDQNTETILIRRHDDDCGWRRGHRVCRLPAPDIFIGRSSVMQSRTAKRGCKMQELIDSLIASNVSYKQVFYLWYILFVRMLYCTATLRCTDYVYLQVPEEPER
ncbi:hypothetical protein BDZ45DRAFT_685518 [Acephala macrosclerotiorum]|nr:hypothetical protein BDZ45DRAFT_685518 [Acephala macrosclerotiorum]